ncbi:MAG: hypothetical protein ACOCQX_03280 [Candidatus Nanoarchaeia archaeon]
MEIGKKSAFFTLISLVMVSILFMVAQSAHMNKMQQESFVVEKRIKSVDYFIEDLERDIERGIYISTHRGLLGVQQHVTSKGNFLNNTDDAFNKIIINGTYNGTYLSVMNNSELSSWFERIELKAKRLSIELDYEINEVSVYHVSPWEIGVKLNTSMNVSDMQGTAYWERDKPLVTNLSIIDFEDPLYNAKTRGRVVNVIKPTNVTDFVDGTNASGLLYHVDNFYYRENNASPSYLMRLRGELNSSPYGIESFVDLRRLEDVGIKTKDKSTIDHIYFSEFDPQAWQINNTYEWLRIDNESERISNYEAEDLVY